MIRTRFKKVLLVAPAIFPDQLLTEYAHVRHISNSSSIFPSIFELNPDLIIFDYDFLGKDIEKTLRRITTNKFYEKIKICCYKNTPNEKTDSLLKALGVDHLLYQEDMVKSKRNKIKLNNLSAMLDTSIMKWMVSASN